MLTSCVNQDGEQISDNSPYPALFNSELNNAKRYMAEVISTEISVPIPMDMAGGYTHEQHKKNYRDLQIAGQLYKITQDRAYADYIHKVFIEYAKIYKGLPKHPTDRSYATGKIFWQCLNDANWMVYGAQAYDAIYDYLTEEERKHIEEEFLKPYADYISVDNPKFFNRVHNHSTWGNAAVGMVGLATRNTALVNRALYGLPQEEIDELAKDNDGGFIYEKGKAKAGFFAQIDYSFSPDGYYGEGPYYQRYAMLPFMIFAQALEDKKPELGIFAYRDSILVKAVEALLQQTTQSDEFFPINDAQKGMSIHPNSVVTAVDVAYAASRKQIFLATAQKQQTVLLTEQGLLVAENLDRTGTFAFEKQSINLRDGAEGDEGGLAILRAGDPERQTTAVLKYTAQGLGHGHYDKLGYLLYDGNTEVMQDYGAARWVNIDQKAGGRYLTENNTWAKQTIAHNTLVIDKTSHFGGEYDIANTHHSDLLFFNPDQDHIQTVGAIESNAYPGVTMKRILALWEDPYFDFPICIDFYDVNSDNTHTYDMPYHFAGQIMSQNFDYIINSPPVIAGSDHGYQHLYVEASADISKEGLQMNWIKDNKFYTLSTTAGSGDKVILGRIGANDPEFNLRRDPVLIHRISGGKDVSFLSIIENHGHYSPVSEVPVQPYSKIRTVSITANTINDVEFSIVSVDDNIWTFTIDKRTGKTIILKT